MNDTTVSTVRVYCGTYKKYNEGSLFGEWIDVENFRDKDDFLDYCTKLHSDESDPELMFQDHEGIPEAFIGESWIAEELWEYLSEIDEDDRPAFEAYCNNGYKPADALSSFRDDFNGYWNSELEFAEHMAGEAGYYKAMEDAGLNVAYFDNEAFARDLFYDYWRDDESGAVFTR